MKNLRTLIAIPLIALTSCATLNQDSLSPLITLGVANAIQFGVPANQQAQVAANIVAVSDLYNSLAGPNGIPTPEQFGAALDKYLPDNQSKALTKTNLLAAYSIYYPDFKDKAPVEQLEFLSKFLAAVRAGAQPFIAGP